jgi:hypothetical protein
MENNMGSEYGRAYANLRKNKEPHTVSREDLKIFAPEFPVASSYPKSLVGVVEIWSEWADHPMLEWTDKSRVRYEVRWKISASEEVIFSSYDIDKAIEFYNNL